jgi:hypothetical protein
MNDNRKTPVPLILAVALGLGLVLTGGTSPAHAQKNVNKNGPPDPKTRSTKRFGGVDFNVNAKQMTTMLEAAQKLRNRPVAELAKKVLKEEVVKVTGNHKGGFGGGGRAADPKPHCTVETRPGTRYHVYLKQKNGKWSITKITS